MIMYYGNEPCAGCHLPATERARPDKKSLCLDCANALASGMAYAIQIEPHTEFFQHYHAYTHEVSKLVHGLLAALHNPSAPYTRSEALKNAWGSNGARYIIPTRCFEPLRIAFEQIDQKVIQIEKELKALPDTVKKALADERTEIFNKGIERGRNLLMQIESGGITMDDFYKNIHNYDVYSLDITKDNSKFVTGGGDKNIIVTDVI